MSEASRADRLERLTNLVLVLLDTSRPLSLRELAAEVAGYPPAGGEAARQAFERDKQALRALGIPLRVETIGGPDQVGYFIKPDEYYLPELGIDPEEATALAFAVASVRLGTAAGWSALAKLGGPVSEAAIDRAGLGSSPGGPALAPVAVLPSPSLLAPMHDAIRRRAVVSFTYRARRRRVEPYVLRFRGGAWYLVGRELSASGGPAVRTFRVDRMRGGLNAGAGSEFEPPEESAIEEIRLLPWSAPGEGADAPVAAITVDARLSRSVAAQLPNDAVRSFDAAGALQLRLPVSDEGAFVSFVAGLGDTAVVEGPESLRAAVIERLQAMAEGPPPGPVTAPAPVPVETAAPQSQARAPAREGPGGLVAGERLRRLLAILVHLARVGDAPIAELALRFSISEDELVHDLELAACCGVPPYTPDELISLFVDGDRVVADGLRELSRPGRLTAEEGFVLAAAARGLLSVPGASGEGGEALASALSKLESALGHAPLSLDISEPEHLEALRAAAEASERVEIVYFSSAAGAPSRRTVDPYQVVLREGRWYLDGWSAEAKGLRRFQVDRVQGVSGTGEAFEVPADTAGEIAARLSGPLSGPDAFIGGPESVDAVIAVPPEVAFGLEQAAFSPLEALPDGRLAAHVMVADAEGWLGRLLLRLGPGAEVLEPPQLRGAGAGAARRALERYEIA
ncbi:MAG: helix-turn-helix transcriptional regulator [Acidimicrobiales bacterium]